MKKLLRVIRWLVVIAVVAIGGLAIRRVGAPPTIEIETDRPGIGSVGTEVEVRISEAVRGLGTVAVELRQGNQVWQLEHRQHERPPFWDFWSDRVARDELRFSVGKELQPALTEGEATIWVEAERAGTWLRHPDPVSMSRQLRVDLTAPRISLSSARTSVYEGGSGVVVYQLAGHAVRDGVRVGEELFPGAPLPDAGGSERFAFFGVPVRKSDFGAENIVLYAEDELGNQSRVAFVSAFSNRRWRQDTVTISDRFLERVVPAILADISGGPTEGSLLEKYLWINRDLRRINGERLLELAANSRQQLLWTEPFLQLRGSQSMASFADYRIYLYAGNEVDRQTHMGFDLASVRRAEVPAANRGVVVLSEYLGIYGNTVVVDHGFGLMSLYAHLSTISVEPGQLVERGAVVGRSGQTGLAGGDHLHYAMLIHGRAVNPIEWWDENWLENRITSKLRAQPDPG